MDINSALRDTNIANILNKEDDSLSHSYNTSDLLSTLAELFLSGKRGAIANTVFGRPNQAYGYDALASTRGRFMQDSFTSIGKPNVEAIQQNRLMSMSAHLGLDTSPILGLLQGADTLTSGMITGNYGASAAFNKIMDFSSAMALARGSRTGGVLDPATMARNIKFAAAEGGEVYKGLFNKDGSINVDQTHGLSLEASSYIIGKSLSDRSVRSRWASKVLEKGPGLSDLDNSLSDKEIDNLKNGVGMTDNALKSFGEYTKKFTGEINKFVASVSKMTGSYDEALNFMQRITGGELFKDTDKAKKARERAANIANGMRVAAANAGISAPELYTTAETFNKAAANSAGFSSANIARGAAVPFSDLGSIGAIALAQWRESNPLASEDEIAQKTLAIGDSVAAYTASTQDQMNALAARLKGRGYDMSEYEKTLKGGNAELQKNILVRMYGANNFLNYMDNKGLAAIDRMQYGGTYRQYAATSLISGRERETRRVGKQKAFDQAVRDFSAGLSGGNNFESDNINREIRGKYAENLLSDQVLQAAGVDDEHTRNKIREQMKGRSVYEIMERLNTAFGPDKSELIMRSAINLTGKYAVNKTMEQSMDTKEENSAIDRLLNDKNTGLSEEDRKELKKRYGEGSFSETGLKGMLDLVREWDPKNYHKINKNVTNGKILKRDAEKILQGFENTLGAIQPQLTEEDLKEAKIQIAQEEERDKLNDDLLKASKNDKEALGRIFGEGNNSVLERAVAGEDYELTGRDYTKNLLIKAYGLDSDKMTKEARDKILDKATKVRNDLIRQGKSSKEVQDGIDKALKGDLTGRKGDYSADVRKAAWDTTVENDIAGSIVGGISNLLSTTAPSVDFKDHDITAEDISTISKKVEEGRKKSPEKQESELYREEVRNLYAEKYKYLLDRDTEEGKKQYDSIMASVDSYLDNNIAKGETFTSSRTDTLSRNIQLTREGAEKQIDKVDQGKATLRAEKIALDRNREQTSYIVGNSADTRSADNVIAQVFKEKNGVNLPEASRAIAPNHNNRFIEQGDSVTARDQNKQLGSSSEKIISEAQKIFESVEDRDVDALVKLDEDLQKKFSEKFKDEGEAKYKKRYADLLNNESPDLYSDVVKELGIKTGSDEDKKLKESFKVLSDRGQSTGGIRTAIKVMHDEDADKDESHRRSDAKKTLGIDRLQTNPPAITVDDKIVQLLKTLVDLLRSKL